MLLAACLTITTVLRAKPVVHNRSASPLRRHARLAESLYVAAQRAQETYRPFAKRTVIQINIAVLPSSQPSRNRGRGWSSIAS